MIDYIWRVNNIDVYYTNETNGGGDFLALEYIEVIKEWYGKVNHTLEWCAGPGFIGYALLANELCNKISFLEMHYPSVEMCQKTKHNSRFKDNIEIYFSDSLSAIPLQEKFDLVVGNPPHWKNIESASRALNFDKIGVDIRTIPRLTEVLVDENWKSHFNFFTKIKPLLSDNGRILLQENLTGSDPKEFKEMVDEANLKINLYAESKMYSDKHIYYLEIMHK
jgi:methylase of polypeptide subunit release factors